MVEVPCRSQGAGTDAAGKPVLTKHMLGRALFTTADPIELAERAPRCTRFTERFPRKRRAPRSATTRSSILAQRTGTGHAHVFNYRKGMSVEATLATKAGSITLRAKDRIRRLPRAMTGVRLLWRSPLARAETLLAGEGATAIRWTSWTRARACRDVF